MNSLSPNKTKIIFAIQRDLRDELDVLREEMSKKLGREVTEAEFLRKIALDHTNAQLKKKGQRPLDLEWESGNQGGMRREPARKRRAA